jgi:hypothetical protein
MDTRTKTTVDAQHLHTYVMLLDELVSLLAKDPDPLSPEGQRIQVVNHELLDLERPVSA